MDADLLRRLGRRASTDAQNKGRVEVGLDTGCVFYLRSSAFICGYLQEKNASDRVVCGSKTSTAGRF